MKRLLLVLTLVTMALTASPCWATTIFANVWDSPSTAFVETLTGSSDTLLVSTVPVKFQLTYPTAGPVISNATLYLTATSTTAAYSVPGLVDQPGYSGSFTIKDPSGTLLSGTFTNASLIGLTGEGQPVLSGSAVLTVAGMTFQTGTTQTFAFTMSAAGIPTLNGSDYVNSFTAGGTANFSATFVPEPVSFLLVGTGLVGLGRLGRKLKK
jgi:hypothetical protein